MQGASEGESTNEMGTLNRVAVVTGANKGLGFAIAKELCHKFEGFVYLTGRNELKVKQAVEEIRKEHPGPGFFVLDINKKDTIYELREQLQKSYTGFDVLFNNAAIAYRKDDPTPFAEQAANTINTDFMGTYEVCKALFPLLKPHARVVNISSSAGLLSRINGREPEASKIREKLLSPDLTEEELVDMMQSFVKAAQENKHEELGWPNRAYSVAKAGLIALTRIQQRQLDKDPREDIIVNAVHPGVVETDMTGHEGEFTAEQAAHIPVSLALLPQDAKEPRGAFVWHDGQIVTDLVDGPKR